MNSSEVIRFVSSPRLGESCELIVDVRALGATEGSLHVEVSWEEPKQRLGDTVARADLVADPTGELRAKISLPGGPLPYEGKWLMVRWHVDVIDDTDATIHSAQFSPAMPSEASPSYRVRPVYTNIHPVGLGSNSHAIMVLAGLLFAGGAFTILLLKGALYALFVPVIVVGLAFAAWGAWPMILRRLLFKSFRINVDPVIHADGYVHICGTFDPRFRSVAHLTATLKEYEFWTPNAPDIFENVWTQLRHTYPTAVERIPFAVGSEATFDFMMLVGENAVPSQMVGKRGVAADLEITLGTGLRQSCGDTRVLISPLSARPASVEASETSRPTPMTAWQLALAILLVLVTGWVTHEDAGVEVAPLPAFDTSERTRASYGAAWLAACKADGATCRRAFNSFHAECFYGKSGHPQPTPPIAVYVRCIQRSWNASQ